jgi:predicted O-methyltransferase YrrM
MHDMTGIPDEQLPELLNLMLNHVGFRKLQRLGFHVQKNDYYSPLNDCDFLETNKDLWKDTVLLPSSIDWRMESQLEVLRDLSVYLTELSDVPNDPPSDCSEFGWNNDFWNNADALVQYGLIRARKPRRYVEVGCGWSSLLLKLALELNLSDGTETAVTLVEPFPNKLLFSNLPTRWAVHQTILQRVDLGIFDRLEAGDFLFYDGSHCAKAASDVNYFFFKILPRLKPGVIIHLHDIFLPEEYPESWIFERGQTWNEQYLLQAFLMNNSAYSILIANRFLLNCQPVELETHFKGIQPILGCSFWMQKLNN